MKSILLIVLVALLPNLCIATRLDASNPDELLKLPVKELAKKHWEQVSKSIASPQDPLFETVVGNKDVFVKYNGLENVNKGLSAVLTNSIWDYATGEKEYDTGFLMNQFKIILNADLADDDVVYTVYDLIKLRNKKEFAQMFEFVNANREKLGTDRVQAFDASLSRIEQLTGSERKLFIDYLTQQAEKYGKKDANYKSMIKNLSDYKGIAFEEIGFDLALAKATKENKLVFVDAYTDWCAPCKLMDKEVFPLEKVGDFFNKNFVSVKINIDKVQEFGTKYGIQAVPTYLFFDGEGKMLFRLSGSRPADNFLEMVKEGLGTNLKR